MTSSKIQFQTIVLALCCSLLVMVIGGQTIANYQTVQQEKQKLYTQQNICLLLEVAPYATWFRSLDKKTYWTNEAYNREFVGDIGNTVMNQLCESDAELLKTKKPQVRLLIVAMPDGTEVEYNVLTYPVYDSGGMMVGGGGIAIKNAPLTSVVQPLRIEAPFPK